MILLITFILQAACLHVLLEDKPMCFFVKTYEENIYLNVNYMVSGLDEDNNLFYITSEDQSILLLIDGVKEKVLRELLSEKGTYYLCFKSKDKSYKMVSFDFDLEGIDKNYAQSDQFVMLNQAIQKTHRNF